MLDGSKRRIQGRDEMRNIALITCFIVNLMGCGPETSSTSGVVGTGGSTTSTTMGGGGASTTTTQTTTSTMISDLCPDFFKSFDPKGSYYGPVFPYPEEVPGAAAEFQWGPWNVDMNLNSFTLGYSSDPSGLTTIAQRK